MKWYSIPILAFALLLTGAGISYASTAVQNFDASILSQTGNSTTIDFKWTNAVSSTQQVITRTDKAGSLTKTFSNVPQGNQTYSYTDTAGPTVTSAANGGTVSTYNYQLSTAQGGNTQNDTASVQYADSNTVTVTTLSAKSPIPPGGANLGAGTYSLVCAPLTATSVYVGWTPNAQNAASGTVWTYDQQTGEAVLNIAQASGYGSIITNHYSDGYYVIRDSRDQNLSNVAGPCAPLPAVSADAPSNLNIFTNGPQAIYLDWKDNSTSTATSTFEVQRFQVTPGAPANVAASAGSGQITLSWDNSAPASTSFYTEIDRSTSPDFSGDLVPYAATSSPFVDSNVTPGTTYYYRLTNVSQVPVQSFYQYPTSTQVVKPAAPSSTAATTSVRAVASAAAPSFAASLSQAVSNFLRSLFGTSAASAQTTPTVNYNEYFKTIGVTTSPSYADVNLTPGTVYMYRVRLVYPGGGASTWSNMVAGVTLPQGAVAVSSSTAPICTAYGFCNHDISSYSFGPQASEFQCSVNANCRGVGRASQQTSEQ